MLPVRAVVAGAVSLGAVLWLVTLWMGVSEPALPGARTNDTDVEADVRRVKQALSKPFLDYDVRLHHVRPPGSCNSIRAAFKANAFGTESGITVADPYKFRTPCVSPTCTRSEACSAAPVKRITADGVIVRHGQASVCCQDLLELLAARMLGVFAEFDFTAFPAAGTLLSAVRDGGVNPWTGDVDIVVMQFEQTFVPSVLARFEALGLVYVATEHPNFENGQPPPGRQPFIGRVCFSLNHKGLNEVGAFTSRDTDHVSFIDDFTVYGDVWSEAVEADTLLMTGDGLGCLFNLTDIFPLRKCEFGALKVPLLCPRRSEKYFELRWGKKWRVPVKGTHGDWSCRGSSPVTTPEQRVPFYKNARWPPKLWGGVGWAAWYKCVEALRDKGKRKRIEDAWYYEKKW